MGRSKQEYADLRAIVEKKMTLHWDMGTCQCWLCKEGRRLGCHPRAEYLPHKAPAATYEGDSECPKQYWVPVEQE